MVGRGYSGHAFCGETSLLHFVCRWPATGCQPCAGSANAMNSGSNATSRGCMPLVVARGRAREEEPPGALVNVLNVRYTNVVNVSQINDCLLHGRVATEGLFPHLESLRESAFQFRFDFGLDHLPEAP